MKAAHFKAVKEFFKRFFSEKCWKWMRKKSNQHFLLLFIFPPLLLMIDYAFADSLCCHHFFSSPALCWIHFNEHCWDLNSISSNLMSHLQRISPGFVSATFTLFTLHLRRARCSLQFSHRNSITLDWFSQFPFAVEWDDGSNLHFFPSVYRCPHWKHQHLLLFASFEY